MRAQPTDTAFSAVVPLEMDVHRTYDERQMDRDKRSTDFIADSDRDIKSGDYPGGKHAVHAV